MSSISTFLLLLGLVVVVYGSRAHNNFFETLTEEQKEAVSKILHGGLTKSEIKEQLHQWVSSQSKEVQEAFQKAEEALEARKARVRSRHMKLLSSASDEAKKLDARIRKIYEDQSLTKQQTCLKVQGLIRSASEKARKELKLKVKECDH
ncbi:hypothetical protein M3Y98_00506600 [Aphelenchoides besseyi]|nr:hypothetical protein M3Y98_00506600 [Aphelenchoides besseyi]KAI6207811.1 hypothetical protein M3Y96_00048400 [Aphelenchoides besseyi]